MEDRDYFRFRIFSYWFFVGCFIIFAPLIVLYSIGYKFNRDLKKFQRTGAISIKTSPGAATVYINGHKITSFSPCVLRELMPGDYSLELDKSGFYPYKMNVNIASSTVAEINATLIPRAKNIEKFESDIDIYKFFIVEHFFGKKIAAFSDKGFYMLDDDFSGAVKIADLDLSTQVLSSIEGIRSNKNYFVFWTPGSVWLIDTGRGENGVRVSAREVYTSKEIIKEVFFGLNSYLIIHDGMRVVAVDFKNPSVVFPVMPISSMTAGVFYDTSSDTLYVRDRVPGGDKFSLFRLNLREIVHDKGTSQARP